MTAAVASSSSTIQKFITACLLFPLLSFYHRNERLSIPNFCQRTNCPVSRTDFFFHRSDAAPPSVATVKYRRLMVAYNTCPGGIRRTPLPGARHFFCSRLTAVFCRFSHKTIIIYPSLCVLYFLAPQTVFYNKYPPA